MKTNLYDFGFIGKRVSQARKTKRYTQAELAELINMSVKNVSRLEHGIMGMSLPTLMSICNTLDVSADYILFGIKNTEQDNPITIMLSELSEQEQLYAENLILVYIEACKNRPE